MRGFVIGSIDELVDHKDAWEELRLKCRAPVFSSYDLAHLWLDNYSNTVRPQVIVVEEKGEVAAIAPLCTYKHSVSGLPVKTLTVIGNGKSIIGYSLVSIMSVGQEEALRELARGIGRADWNLMQLFDLEPTPPVLRFLDLIKEGYHWQPYEETNNIYYEFPREGRIDASFGRHTGKVLRGVRRRLESEHRLQFRILEDPNEAERAMRTYVDQHVQRWERKGGSMFREERNARMLVRMAKLLTARRQAVICEVLIDGEVAGQSFAIFDGEVVRGYRLGMDDKYADYSPGKLAMVAAMEESRARGYKGMDLLRGKEDYKMHMMTHERTLPAIQAHQGSLLLMSRISRQPLVRRLDQRLQVRDRLLRGVYRG